MDVTPVIEIYCRLLELICSVQRPLFFHRHIYIRTDVELTREYKSHEYTVGCPLFDNHAK